MAMAREMLLAGVDPEEFKKTEETPPPQTPRQKWENYWYHYKWLTIGLLFLLVLVIAFTVQALSRNEPDYTILIATEDPHDNYTLAPMERLLEKYGRDLDGDGEVEVRVIPCNLGAKEYATASDQVLNYQILQTHLVSGDVMLFAFEQKYFNWFMGEMSESKTNFLTPLGVEGDGVSEDGYRWSWAEDPRIKGNAVFSSLPPDMEFGVRVAAGTASGRQEEQQQCLALLRALIADKPLTATE